MFPHQRDQLRLDLHTAAPWLLAYTALMDGFSSLVSYGGALVCPLLPRELLAFLEVHGFWLANALISYPIGILSSIALLRKLPRAILPKAPHPTPAQAGKTLAVALGLLYLSSSLTNLLLLPTETSDYVGDLLAEQPLLITLFATVLLAPVMEELIFRKLLLDRLVYLGEGLALMISSLFFGLFHTNLYQFFYAWAVGLVLGWIRLRTGRMVWNVLLHMFINLFCGSLLPLLPSHPVTDSLVGSAVLLLMGYSVVTLIREKPWRSLSPGPTGLSRRDKVICFFTAPILMLTVVIHLALSVVYILLF